MVHDNRQPVEVQMRALQHVFREAWPGGRIVAPVVSITPMVALLALACSEPSSAPRSPETQPGASQISNLPEGMTEAEVRAHVMAPAHVRDVEVEDVDPAREARYDIGAQGTAVAPNLDVSAFGTPTLNLGTFGLKIHKALKDSTAGYMLQVRQNGVLVHTGVWSWARTPTDVGQGWSEATHMHVASVSKFLTAVALVKALDAKGISYNSKIIGYLPQYWTKGPNIDQITFRHLLTHTSGLSAGNSATDYAYMKAKVAAGVSTVGTNAYANMNFGLMRILIPIITGSVSRHAKYSDYGFANDLTWDAVTIKSYKQYMQDKVFTPAGVVLAGFAPTYYYKDALAYKSSYALNVESGWNSGDLATVAGPAGWRLSTKELLNVMNHVRRKNTIISAAKAQYMLDNFFGIDQVISTPAGKIYNKNGGWGKYGRKEQCVAYFLPNGMELALFVNSPIGFGDRSLRTLVKDAFIASLTY
jgi:CubicO group peptidase (beta-lactamase class C family)